MKKSLSVAIVARYTDAPAGLGTLTRGLLGALDDLDTPHRFTAYTPSRPNFSAPGIDWRVVPTGRRLSERAKLLLWDQSVVRRAIRADRPDIIHWLHPTGSLLKGGAPTVITVCDATPWQSEAYRADPKMRFYAAIDRRAARAADHLITISEHSKHDLQAALGVPGKRITVTHLAAPPPVPNPPTPSVGGDYVLFMGGSEKRKNPGRLIRAFFAAELDPDIRLVVSGRIQHSPIDDDLNTLLVHYSPDERRRVILPGMVSDAELQSLYAHAFFFAYPSLREGFGIPPLEAMSYGTPVLTANTTSLPEVVGRAALTVDPTDEAALTQAVKRLATDAPLRRRLAVAGPKQAASFSWRRTAEQTLAVYERLARP
jgi:glycosyltransferase involved in cell wall biosynthesis